MSCKNTEEHSIDSKWIKYISVLLVLELLKHCNIWKTEVAIEMCFAKQLFLLFLVSDEKLLVVLAKCLKKLSEQVHF